MTEVEGGLPEPEELEPAQGSLDLAAPEDRHTREEWEAATAAVLRKSRRIGDDAPDSVVWEKLARTTLDGIAVTPLGTPELLDDLVTSGRPARTGAWDIRAHHGAGAAKAVNEAVLVDLDGGVSSLWVETDGSDLATVLDGVLLDLAPVVLDAIDAPLDAARAFVEYAAGRELAAGTNLGVDATAATDVLVAAASLAREAGTLALVVDGTAVHDRGASDVQELAHSLRVGVGALRALADAGVPVAEAAALIEFRYAATDEQFPTIAKLRAARRLWARVLELSQATGTMRQHVVTSKPMMTRYDPYVNMLRTTVAAFAAGVGGADAVTVLPFDSPLGRPDGFGRRIARNTSHLLVDESHVAKVADPAGGSYAVEKLTDDLARAAWDLFGRLEDGADLDAEISATVERREAEVAKRKRPLTGLSEFPNLAETLPEREDDGAWAGVRSYGASFEAMRDTPPATHVFLATLGPIAQHTARATFASNLFAAGGVAVDVAGATKGADDLVAAYAGQQVVCLAGSDAAYAEWGQAAAEALRSAGASYVVVAGKPMEGTDDSCATGVDALAFLTRIREQLA
ncbi:MAG TPA: methylmalonyl-CoA mutase family protein [Nocardioides sp.]|uniref:methylmalonyl-CoA mutase family protein n=1 Tax=Nocardioides sp. TaxID=35761 RepID=UPI002C4DFB5D|nr:methylmalonyl-CoA mutase family protein [Nocardioides sp.]HTW18466.1 methylmalonyl-CoA mutase family protein [Nocardioides sp.]